MGYMYKSNNSRNDVKKDKIQIADLRSKDLTNLTR